MSDDLLDEFGFPLSLSEKFLGRTMRVTNIRPQSSATQDEDWYEFPVPRHHNESTAAGLLASAPSGRMELQVTAAFPAAVDTHYILTPYEERDGSISYRYVGVDG